MCHTQTWGVQLTRFGGVTSAVEVQGRVPRGEIVFFFFLESHLWRHALDFHHGRHRPLPV